MKLTRRISLVPVLLTSAVLAGCSSSNSGSPSTDSTIAASLPALGLNELANAVAAAGLESTLNGPGPFTLFAPTDAAFAAVPSGAIGDPLQGAVASLPDVLLYHAIGAEVPASTAVTLSSATTLGGDVVVDRIGGTLFVNDARVIETDLAASNGIVHKVDRVLLPPTDVVSTLRARGFDTLLAAVVAAELDDDLAGPGPFTVLAPTDDAFALLDPAVLTSLLQPQNQQQLIDILTYHVLPGRLRAGEVLETELATTLAGIDTLFAPDPASATGAAVNGVSIRAINIPCTNGIVHVLDAVLTIPEAIPALAQSNGLTTLLDLVVAADLDGVLAGPGPFTVFAPTNAAFADLPSAVVDALLNPANQSLLQQVLLYHVVGDELTAADVLSVSEIITAEGSPILVQPGPMLNDANLLLTDVLGANGIVHVIDKVLIPPGFTLP